MIGLITQNPWISLYFFIGVIVAVWMGATAMAPIRQRNEARAIARAASSAKDVSASAGRVPFASFLELASAAGWNVDWGRLPIGKNSPSLFATMVRQAAVDGTLELFARPGSARPIPLDSTPLTPVPSEHFKTHELCRWDQTTTNYDMRTRAGGRWNEVVGVRDIHIGEKQARDWLHGDGMPPETATFSAKVVTRTEIPYHGLSCMIAIEIKNIGTAPQKAACLVKIEEADGLDGVPLPLVLRTEGQMAREQSGRFNLSAGERKIVPLFFRDDKDRATWWFFDECGNGISRSAQDMHLRIGVYGDGTSGTFGLPIISHTEKMEDGSTSYKVGYGISDA